MARTVEHGLAIDACRARLRELLVRWPGNASRWTRNLRWFALRRQLGATIDHDLLFMPLGVEVDHHSAGQLFDGRVELVFRTPQGMWLRALFARDDRAAWQLVAMSEPCLACHGDPEAPHCSICRGSGVFAGWPHTLGRERTGAAR